MNSRISSYFFFILLLGSVVAAVLIFLPFLSPIVLAAAAAVVAYPLYHRLTRIIGVNKFKDSVSAFITVTIIIVVVLVPLFFILIRIYSEIQSLYEMLTDEGSRSHVIDALNNFSSIMSHYLFNAFPAYSFDSLNVTEYIKNALEWIFNNIDNVFRGLSKVLGYVFVFLISLFYFLRDGAELKKRFVSWSPLLDTHDEYISKTMKRAVRSVFAGTIAVSIIQGSLTGIGFWIFGIPAPAVWGSVAAIASLIPAIGTSLVVIPGIIYLFISGNYPFAIGLMIWGGVAVGTVDNILGPYLVNRGVSVHPLLILISVLGGIATLGPIGFIMGPLILAFLFALLELYRTAFAPSAGETKN